LADVFTILGYAGGSWSETFGGSDKLAFCGSTFGSSISVNGFQDSSHRSDATMYADQCTPNHIQNCKYISTTQIDIGGGTVTLNTTNVAQTDCTIRWSYEDDTPTTTSLSNCLLFAYDGTTLSYAPTDVTFLCFERTASAINTDRDSDTPGAGGGWDSTKGCGGQANGLILDDQTTAQNHYFYLGMSASPDSKGSKTAFKIRLEFDAQ
jgi:hypothetical protein